MNYVDTRARTTDGVTSKDAAKHAVTEKAATERRQIFWALRVIGPMTAREIAANTGIDYIEVQRRISEVGFITKTADRRDGCFVWEAV